MRTTSDTSENDRYPGTPCELLEARCTDLDPVVHGFAGALTELRRIDRGTYEVRQLAVETGNRLFVFTTVDEERARAMLESVVRDGGQTLSRTPGT